MKEETNNVSVDNNKSDNAHYFWDIVIRYGDYIGIENSSNLVFSLTYE